MFLWFQLVDVCSCFWSVRLNQTWWLTAETDSWLVESVMVVLFLRVNTWLLFLPCRWKAVQLSLGGMWQKVCPLWWAFSPPKDAHWREEVCLQRVRPALHAQRPLDQTCSAPHDLQEGDLLARRNRRPQQSGPAHGPKQRPCASSRRAHSHRQLTDSGAHRADSGPQEGWGVGSVRSTRHIRTIISTPYLNRPVNAWRRPGPGYVYTQNRVKLSQLAIRSH